MAEHQTTWAICATYITQGLLRKNPNWCSPWTTSVEPVSCPKKNLPGCSGLITYCFVLFLLASDLFRFLIWYSFLLMCCRSFIEISNGGLSKSQAEDGIKAMMKAAGFDDKEKISWEDFHFLLQDHEKELQFAQLNVKGCTKFCVIKCFFYPPLTDLLWWISASAVCAGMEKQGKKRLSRDQRVSFICPTNR